MVDAAWRGALDVFWTVGGNFLDTLPDPAAVATALGRVGTRLHQDVVVTSMMLLPPADTVSPITTRWSPWSAWRDADHGPVPSGPAPRLESRSRGAHRRSPRPRHG